LATDPSTNLEVISLGIIRSLPRLESWLDEHAASWIPLSEPEYKALVRRWSNLFGPLIRSDVFVRKGSHAFEFVESRLPASIILFSGVEIPALANQGGLGASAYRAVGLRALDRELANQLELVAVSVDLTWCCVFSHEAGSFVSEQLYERDVIDNS
jgi:hypothetical protein